MLGTFCGKGAPQFAPDGASGDLPADVCLGQFVRAGEEFIDLRARHCGPGKGCEQFFRFGGKRVAGDGKGLRPVLLQEQGDGIRRDGLHRKNGDEGRPFQRDGVLFAVRFPTVCGQRFQKRRAHPLVPLQRKVQHKFVPRFALFFAEGAPPVSCGKEEVQDCAEREREQRCRCKADARRDAEPAENAHKNEPCRGAVKQNICDQGQVEFFHACIFDAFFSD